MSVTTYNVEAGKDRATIELSGETKVVFSFDPNIIAVEAVSGSVNVSLDEGATTGDDGCDTLSEGQSTRMNPIFDKCVYVNGTGTIRVWGGRSGEDCPFKKQSKGGEVTLDDNVTQNSANPVKSSGIYTALNSKQNVMQYSTMPVITTDMLGKVVQYVGTTGNSYTQGYFYIAATDGAVEPTYSWIHLPTQNGYSETVLWEYTDSKPTTLILSQSVTNFDAIITYGCDKDNSDAFQTAYHLVSEIQRGLLFGVGVASYTISGNHIRQWYDYVNTTTFEISNFGNTNYIPLKVIGIKYGG